MDTIEKALKQRAFLFITFSELKYGLRKKKSREKEFALPTE